MTAGIVSEQRANRSASYRWIQLLVGIIAMVMIANFQYGWTLFVNPISSQNHWSKAAIQVSFTIFVLAETWLVPFEAYLVDRIGPRLMVAAGGILVAAGWGVNSAAHSLTILYLGGALAGIGAGIVYGTAVGNALKWFPDRRGLAAGLTAAGFGAGAALTVIPISRMIGSQGYQSAFLYFGIGQGLVVFVVAMLMRAPAMAMHPAGAGQATAPQAAGRPREYTPLQMLRTPVFWVMYVMFVMVAMGGLMATAQLGPMATDFKVAKIPVSLIGITLPALTFALSLDRIMNGITRPFFGWVSDQIGRENTMFIAFALEGGAITLLIRNAHNPALFVVFTGMAFFAWGEIYSLFPATSGDLFGRAFATTNYGLLYTAKGTASLLVPIGSLLREATGSWNAVFYVAIVFDFATALLALFALKPLRRQTQARALAPDDGGGLPSVAGASE